MRVARVAIAALAGVLAACTTAPQTTSKTSAAERAARRAYDGAPPVIPHDDFGNACPFCHAKSGREIPTIGWAPALPHQTDGRFDRCRMCHVFQQTGDQFATSTFRPLPQDLRRGRRQNPDAPPVIPHQVLLRENCAACHSGPAARAEIRTPHSDRHRCRQCHVEQQVTTQWPAPVQ